MRDLAAVDRQLAELAEGAAPEVRPLLGRILGNDRSLARLNELLESLGSTSAAPPSARPPAAASLRDPLAKPAARSGTLRGTPAPPARPAANGEPSAEVRIALRSDAPVATRPNPPGVRGSLPPRIVSPLAPVQGDALKTATPWPPVQSSANGPAPALRGDASAAPRARDTLVDAAVPPPPMPVIGALEPLPKVADQVDEVELDAATAALFGVTMPPGAKPESAPAPAAEASAPAPPPDASAHEATRESRANMRALLDREIDPNDFPSSHPPRAATRSIPPPLPRQPAPQDGFEMLIDDEADIMEIDDVELEEIE